MPTQYLIYIKIAVVAIIFAVGVGLGVHIEQPKIDKLNQQVGEYKVAIDNFTAVVQEQNKGIEAAVVASTERENAANEAINKAQNEAETARHTAASILATKAPKGNLCAAASNAFKAELKAERAK